MKILILLIINLSCSLSANAADKITKMKVTVNFGDKQTIFEIPDSKKLIVIVNGRKKETLRGNIENAVKRATLASKEKSNDKTLCRRKHIELNLTLNGKETTTHGCIDSKTPAAVKLTELSNLMLFM